MTFDEVERRLRAQLQDETKDRKTTLRQLANMYSEGGRYDQALYYLRQQILVEPDLEQKAACVLAMGGTAERQQDFAVAVRFYREALAMEPERNDVWFFIHNNLGYSLNRLGQFAEGETFCRAAVEINPSRPNGHKNLGIALAGQAEQREAAKCFVMATKVAPGDTRSLDLLKDLLQQHQELEYEIGRELARCEEMVKFAAAAIQRARAGKVLKMLLGCNDSGLDEMFTAFFRSMTAGAVEVSPTSHWKDFIERACSGDYDLAFVMPNNLVGTSDSKTDPWAMALSAISRIKGNSSTAMIISGVDTDLEQQRPRCRDAGADEVIELPFHSDVLAEATRRVLLLGKR